MRVVGIVRAVVFGPKRLWRQLTTWPVIGTLLGLSVSAGVGVLSMTPPLFAFAKLCFIVSAVILWLKSAHWLATSRAVRWERMILAFLVFGASGVAIVEAWQWISRNQQTASSDTSKSPIAASPVKLSLSNLFSPIPNDLKGHIDIRIYNRSNDPYYQVIAKIVLRSDALSVQQVNVAFPSLEEKVRLGQSHAVTANEVMGLRGKDDEGRQGFIIVIRELDPQNVFPIRLTTDVSAQALPESDIVETEIVSFKTEPPTVTKGHDASGLFFNYVGDRFHSEKTIIFCPSTIDPSTLKFDRGVVVCTRDSTIQQ